jgi:hypothetical protein
LWIFLGSLISSLLALPAQSVMMRQIMESTGLADQGIPAATGGGLVGIICGAPIAAVISVVVFAIVVGIVQFLAKMFGGTGTFDQLAYAIAAIVAPFYVVSGLLGLLSAIPYAGACFGILGLFLGLYILVLEIMAVKGVNRFGWGAAIGSMLLPVLAIACCFSVAVAGMFSLLAPQMQDIFNSIATQVPSP